MDKRVLERIDRLRKALPQRDVRCANCGQTIYETVTGAEPTESGIHCKACFIKIVGEEMEAHPVFKPLPKPTIY
ncbi:MAG: hypothetical protein O8C63_00645 [Candidatus Methanoperedens sp.]|nr:hypothetical protein [Candidatus Methanoperedens sp.]